VPLALALGLAAVARVAWLWAKPFWRDEAWVARVAGQPLDALLRDPYPVPIGFVALVKATGALPLLPPEVTLRLVPLAAGLLALPALAALARRLAAPAGTAIAAAWLAAGLPALVYYSRELKPYSLDLLLAVVVPWLALVTVDAGASGDHRRGRLAAGALIACAVLTPWVCYGGTLVVAPALAWLAWRSGRRNALAWGAAAAFAASFAAAYWTVLIPQSEIPSLRTTWHDELGPDAPQPPPARAAAALARYFTVSLPYLFLRWWPLAAVLAGVGLWTWPRERRALLAGLCLAPALATALAVGLGRYVTAHGRFLLFAAPAIVLMVAAGLVSVTGAAARRLGRGGGEQAGALVAVLAACAWTIQGLSHRVGAYRNDPTRYFLFDVLHEVEPIIEEAERQAGPGTPVMVSRYAGEPFLFYARGRLPGALVCTRRTCPDDGPVFEAWLRGIRDHGFMILLAEEERSGLRNTARAHGLDVRPVARARGVRLWELRRAGRRR
jgi:hypothetical protein